MKCYGTGQYNRRADCPSCQLSLYCRDARDPKSYAIAYEDEHGMESADCDRELEAAFGFEPACENAENVNAPEPPVRDVREIFQEILRAGCADPIRVYILIGKLSGLSHRQIGKTCGMTKQAISKHCNVMRRQSETLGRFLKMRFAPDDEIARMFRVTRYQLRRNDGRRANRKKCETENGTPA